VPRGVIAEARRYLEHLEAERDRQRAAAPGAEGGAAQTELPLFRGTPHPTGTRTAGATDALREALKTIEPDELSPKKALEILYQLRGLAED
jgi:DNA mismatch repair protein MutS